MRRLFALSLVLFVLACDNRIDEPAPAEVFYIPIGTYTFLPVTMDTIEESAHRQGAVVGGALADIVSILKQRSSSNQFDNGTVRIKIVLPDAGTFFIDNNGGVFGGGEKRNLDEVELKKLDKLVEVNLLDE